MVRAAMNAVQANAFDTIDGDVRAQRGGFYFINAPGGTGKTFTATALTPAPGSIAPTAIF